MASGAKNDLTKLKPIKDNLDYYNFCVLLSNKHCRKRRRKKKLPRNAPENSRFLKNVTLALTLAVETKETLYTKINIFLILIEDK